MDSPAFTVVTEFNIDNTRIPRWSGHVSWISQDGAGMNYYLSMVMNNMHSRPPRISGGAKHGA